MCSGSAGLQLLDSTFDTTVNTQLAFRDNPGILLIEPPTIAGVGVDAGMPNTRDISSRFANTAPDPLVVIGPAGSMDHES